MIFKNIRCFFLAIGLARFNQINIQEFTAKHLFTLLSALFAHDDRSGCLTIFQNIHVPRWMERKNWEKYHLPFAASAMSAAISGVMATVSTFIATIIWGKKDDKNTKTCIFFKRRRFHKVSENTQN